MQLLGDTPDQAEDTCGRTACNPGEALCGKRKSCRVEALRADFLDHSCDAEVPGERESHQESYVEWTPMLLRQLTLTRIMMHTPV